VRQVAPAALQQPYQGIIVSQDKKSQLIKILAGIYDGLVEKKSLVRSCRGRGQILACNREDRAVSIPAFRETGMHVQMVNNLSFKAPSKERSIPGICADQTRTGFSVYGCFHSHHAVHE